MIDKLKILKQIRYNTVYRRLFAKIFDYILIAIIVEMIYFLMLVQNYGSDFSTSEPTTQFFVENKGVIATILVICYFILFHFFGGQTVGKMILNIKVWKIDETNKINFPQAILRNISDIFFALITFLLAIDYLPIILIFIWTMANVIQIFASEKHRSIDDLIAKTIVLKLSNTVN